MIQKIESSRVELPVIYLVENEEDWNNLPAGIPRILGTKSELNFIRIYLEFQVLYRSCVKTGLSIKWLDCLAKLGYKNLREYSLSSGGTFEGAGGTKSGNIKLDNFIEDQYLVNFDRLSELKVLPVWLDDLRASVETNIINEVTFDPTAFNKQLGMNVGAAATKTNKKNLLILDVSASMPDGVVKTLTNLAKLMSKRFYADLIITGGQSFFVDYERVPENSIVDIAAKAGRSNEGAMYREIIKVPREYGTVISFGDNDNPGGYYNGSNTIICNIKCETLLSLHTEGKRTTNVTGYARCLTPKKETKIIQDWINSINK